MTHKHHIIPKHMGGSDDPDNLIELSVSAHAEAHKKLYEEYGHWQDYVACQGLAKLSPKEDLVKRLQSEGGKKRQKMYPNPFAGSRTKSNFAVNETHRAKTANLAKSKSAMEKRKKTFAQKKHQQKENNSQFGKVWCVEQDAKDLKSRKIFDRNEIPKGWIPTTLWTDQRKDKSNNAYGRHWYNDGERNYYLKPTDAKIEELKLQKRRLIK